MKERPFWISLLAVVIFGSLSTIKQTQHQAVEAARHQSAARQAQARLEQQVRDLQKRLEATKAGSWTKDEWLSLKNKGLKEPTQDLITDLQKRNELLPHKGVLGGAMGFHQPEGIQILSPRWAVAPFEDGHINGKALLEYQVSGDGKITWRVLDSYIQQ